MKPSEDGTLEYAMSHNPLSFGFDAVEEILASLSGENDGPSWHWLLRLKDGSHKYVAGGCDYTGWDCQSSLIEIPVPNPNDLALVAEIEDYSNRPVREIFEQRRFVDSDGKDYTPSAT